MRAKEEEGQAVIVVALAMSLFLFGAIGLGIDGAHMYASRQMAQSAADAAAQAGIMSIFDGTNAASSNPGAFSTGGAFTCGSTDSRTPCAYANLNGFGGTGDTVTVDFPSDSVVPGVKFSGSDPTNLIRVTVQRSVKTTLMGMLGQTASTISATAMAGIVDVPAPVPIIITHPTLAGSFSANGGPTVQICGGPSRSIQVNSGNSGAVSYAGSGGNVSIDLSHAGPPDPGNCTSGTGADFGVWGGPGSSTYAKVYSFGSTGHYQNPASPMLDPLAGVAPPPVPGSDAPNPTPLANGQNGCPASPVKSCMLYFPGLYPKGLKVKNETAIMSPGIYYIQNEGIKCKELCSMYMATGVPADSTTGWAGNVLFYNTGTSAEGYGPISIGANGNVSLVGSPSNSQYFGILFFEDRNAPALAHSLGGRGSLSLLGTVYLTNTLQIMNANPSQYQSLSLQGNSGNSTYVQGNIIVGALNLGGNGSITMDLNSTADLDVREVALVN